MGDAQAVRNRQVYVSQIWLNTILGPVTIRVEIKVPGNRAWQVITIIACRSVCTCNGRYRCGVCAFSLGVTRRVVRISLIHIGRRAAGWHSGCPVAIYVCKHSLGDAQAVCNRQVYVGQIWLNAILGAIAIRVDVEMSRNGTWQIVTIIARRGICARNGRYRRGVRAFSLSVPSRVIRIGLVHIGRGAACRYRSCPVTVGIGRHRLRNA